MTEATEKRGKTGMERVPTGIPGFDEMVEGGLERNSTTLVIGGCGSGKTTFCMQFLYRGATEFDEPGVYVSFGEKSERLKKHMLQFGWDLDKLEGEDKLRILHIEPDDVMHIIKEDYGAMVDAVNDIKAKRIVVDSVSSIEAMIENDFERREDELKLCEWLSRHDCTSLIISEAEQTLAGYSRQGVMEFVVDGVIVLYNVQRGSMRENALEILKMRGTKHMKKIVPFTIEKGINVFPAEQIFGREM